MLELISNEESCIIHHKELKCYIDRYFTGSEITNNLRIFFEVLIVKPPYNMGYLDKDLNLIKPKDCRRFNYIKPSNVEFETMQEAKDYLKQYLEKYNNE